MDLVQDMRSGTLYDLNCTFLLEAQFIRESSDTMALFISEKPSEDFPNKFFLMPEGKQYDFRAFVFTLTEKLHPCRKDGRDWYTAHAVTKDVPEERKNFRVYVTFRASLFLEGQPKEYSVKIKDIGTGGFQFVSKQKFQPGTVVSTIFPVLKTPVHITARIKKQRPVRREGVYGYGCQFLNLQPAAEMAIRNYVFQTEVLQAKAKKELEEYASKK